LNSLEILVNI